MLFTNHWIRTTTTHRVRTHVHGVAANIARHFVHRRQLLRKESNDITNHRIGPITETRNKPTGPIWERFLTGPSEFRRTFGPPTSK